VQALGVCGYGPNLAKGDFLAKSSRSGATISRASAWCAGWDSQNGTSCGRKVRTNRLLRSLAGIRRPNPRKKVVSSSQNAWSNEESELVVRASAQLASPLSDYLAKVWGFARLGPNSKVSFSYEGQTDVTQRKIGYEELSGTGRNDHASAGRMRSELLERRKGQRSAGCRKTCGRGAKLTKINVMSYSTEMRVRSRAYTECRFNGRILLVNPQVLKLVCPTCLL
jgi:hypothetical protein